MGEPPLNAVVLADFHKLADAWRQIEPDDVRELRGANRSYLVHPLSVGGAFHPKTALLANGKEGVLLVGSGNLGLHGMERGNEVFARYESRREADAGNFGVWRSWANEIVEHAGDPLLSNRWADVLGRAPWLSTTRGASTFVTNWSRPLIEQLLDGIAAPVDALWLTAPFFDRDLAALRELLRRTSPGEITLFLGRETSVDGKRVQSVLRATDAKVTISLYEPRDYVHAKLIAIFEGSTARVLSGSANLSAPALLRAVRDGGHANAEAGSLVEMPAARAQALFVPPDHEVRAASDDLLLELQFKSDQTGTETPVHLVAAVRQASGFVFVTAKPATNGLALTDGSVTASIVGDRTDAKWPQPDGTALVWLVRGDEPVSNRVPLADAQALAQALNERTTPTDRPTDLDELDAQHPIGRLLADLHQAALFDVNEHPITKRIADLRVQNPEVDLAFWERLHREQLAQDPRLDRYLRRSGTAPLADELSWLLEQMLARVPAPNVLRLLSGGELDRETSEREGQRWSTEKRLAVRAYNVLHRWSLAVADPRVRWLSDLAPVRHYELLLAAFTQIWVQQEAWIPEHRMAKLLETLLGTFVRTDRAAGYLARLADEDRAQALAALASGPGPGLAAGLIYLALRNAAPATFFDWQPFLVPGLDWGVVVATPASAGLVASASTLNPSAAQIQKRLDQIARYIDDEHWCARRADELGLQRITLSPSDNPFYPLRVQAAGAGHLLTDPRIATLVREVLAYRRETGLRLTSGNDVLAIAVGLPMYGRVGGREIATNDPITIEALSELEAAGHALGTLLVQEESVAS